jgi:UDP-galactopyranose mutase
MRVENLVIGAGYAGAVIARCLAEKGEEVLIVEKHDHVGGHAYDRYDDKGILIHEYGPHIFHTNDEAVWAWLSRFTDWYHYQHRVLAFVDGRLVPLPVSVETLNELYGLSLDVEGAKAWVEEKREKIEKPANSEEVVLAGAGRDIYEKFFKHYTYKQWGLWPSELDTSVISRVPLRLTRDTRYFTDRYQGLPKRGYAEMFRAILHHPNIRVMLNTDYFEVKGELKPEKIFYTGPIDAYFECRFGKLAYRSVRFEYESFDDREFFQEAGTVNYPNDYDFTRITEYKRLTGQKSTFTTIAREYPQAEGEAFYPVPDKDNSSKAKLYHELAAKEINTRFVGRLAEYRYYNMDAVTARALSVASESI